ncbi:MAG: ParB/RepB/Spo0J family partition protein [Armatimonadetes bacterium]|nr:ParB/RepB/Spo0J family partition protein [Armatimonadota bacterium]
MRRALGKGLSQLLGEEAEVAVVETTETPKSTIPVDAIIANTRQPRVQFDEDALEELSASIKEFGVLQPLIVRPTGDKKYELIAGERRLRASKLAGLKEVPVVIRAASAQVSLEIALIENVQREDISAIECALAYQRLADEFDMTHDQIARRVGKSRAAIANTIRLLKLPKSIQGAVLEGVISEGHARALLMVESPVRMAELFEKIVRDGLSVREAEKYARGSDNVRTPGTTSGKSKRTTSGREIDPNWQALAAGMSEYFGSPVQLEPAEVGGKLTLEFYSDEDLQRILDILGIHL